MRAPSHALVVGSADDLAVVDRVRARPWASIDVHLDGPDLPNPALGALAHRAVPDASPLLDVDVLVFRPPFATAAVCTACGVAALDEDVLIAHEAATGHAWRRPYESMVRGLVETLLTDIGRLRGRGLVVELDEDPWSDACAWPPDLRAPIELELVAMLLRVADVVVTGSPEAAAAAERSGARDVALVRTGSPNTADERAVAWQRAAERAGSGLLAALGATASMVADAAESASARFEHRCAIRALDDSAAAELAERRATTAICWGVAEAADRLVSVVVPVLAEGRRLAERAVRSALASEGVEVEVLVVGGGESGAREAVAAVADARAVWIPVVPPSSAVMAAGAAATAQARGIALATGLAAARGSWFLLLRPEAILTPEAISTLLDATLANALEAAYGRVMLLRDGELAGMAGAWPPSPATIPAEAALVSGGLRAVAVDTGAWIDGEDAIASLWRRFLALGARVGALDDVVAAREIGAGVPVGSAP